MERGEKVEPLLNVLREAGQASIGLFTLPYFYIAIALVWWHARLGVTLQRKLFHVRLHGSLSLTITRVLTGIVAGALLSLVSLGAGANFTSETLIFLWVTMGILALFRLRYICLAYAAGALGLLQALVEWTGLQPNQGMLEDATEMLASLDVPGLLFMAGVLHIVEGLLVRLQSSKLAFPLFLLGKRGKPMGAYALSGVWPIPMLWLIPAAGGGFTMPWTPLFGIGGEIVSWSLLAFPVLIGFSDRTAVFWPEEKAKASGNLLMLYGVIIAGMAAGAQFWSPLVIVASIAAFLLHEALLFISRWREAGRDPRYSHDSSGVKILGVLPGTPAAEMGLQAGEVIRKVNSTAVRSKVALYAALQIQSAFCKLEVVNREGHIKFLQRARYEGEHYQLGLILAPDESVEYVAPSRSGTLWQAFQEAGARRFGNSPTMLARKEAIRAEAELAATAVEEAQALAAQQVEDAKALGLPPRVSQSRKSSV